MDQEKGRFLLKLSRVVKINCEMCGKETDLIYITEIEGTELKVCKNCSRFGKVKKRINLEERKEENKKKEIEKRKEVKEELEEEEFVVVDYARKIKEARERMGLKQEEFAKKINEKVSLIHKIESGHLEPSIELAKKIGKFLKIRLIEKYSNIKVKDNKNKDSGVLTIGDIINLKKN